MVWGKTRILVVLIVRKQRADLFDEVGFIWEFYGVHFKCLEVFSLLSSYFLTLFQMCEDAG